ncbi:hypothetical protein BDD12DRAFT_906306 [Trichophaea hybrida]|nr:hypothetical protein BDD12DRAFT_906306 [Trichophaea hybrida]
MTIFLSRTSTSTMPTSSERSFHHAQIIANARIIFPSHDVLLGQDGADHDTFLKLFGRSKRMLGEKVKGYAKGLKSASGAVRDRENDELRKENEVRGDSLQRSK